MGLVLISLLCIHCADQEKSEESESKELTKKELQGSWEVIAATRDGDRTRTLDNTVFRFTDDSMYTNLPTQDDPATYAWDENHLVRSSGDLTIYNVHTLNKDSLEFSVVLRGSTFRMYLNKKEDIQEESEE